MDNTGSKMCQKCPALGVGAMLFNTTFINISVISWWSVLLVEEIRVPGENRSCSIEYISPEWEGPGWLNELGSWIT